MERTAAAIAHYDTLMGKYPYPQITNVHRLEGGGTEFPMMVMNGSPSPGLILHEVGHQWMHAALANNEFKEGWLDEGLTSFTNSWQAEETQGPVVWLPQLETVIAFEQAGRTQPIATEGKNFTDFDTYGQMTYTKASLVLRMLRDYLGSAATRRALRDYYQSNRLRHVTERDLEQAFERAHGSSLGWFFEQWFHTTGTLDYGVEQASTTQLPDGGWRTRVKVRRAGDNWMPVVMKVGDVLRKLESREREQIVEVDTSRRPTEVVLDPDWTLIDIDPRNNRKTIDP